MSDAAVAELFLVGSHAVIANDTPYKFIPYRKHMPNTKPKSDCFSVCSDSVPTKEADIIPTKNAKNIAQAA